MALTEHLIIGVGHRIDIGTRVKIIHQPDKYRNYDLLGKIGVVRSTHLNNITIQIDGMFNKASGRGYFYLSPGQLIYANENDTMEENNMSNNITNYLQAIKIKFVGDPNTCGYVYASFEPDLKVGDLVVVKPAHHSIALARVEEILEGTSYETAREVVSKVDTTAYNERVKVRDQAAELKAKMQERAKKLQDVALYQMLAKDDPEMQDLLNRYQSLPNF